MSALRLSVALLLVFAGCAPPAPPPDAAPGSAAADSADAADAPPEPQRITVLSDREVEGYLAGQGMGLAIPAERNHYPGPRHVLELRDTLGLSPAQQAYAEELRQRVTDEAPGLGADYVAAERALDSLFIYQVATEANVRRATQTVARALADLRALHLTMHVALRDTLRAGQVLVYDELRGYPTDTTGARSEE